MSNCRIGKIKPKSGGEIRLLPTPQRSSAHRMVEGMAEDIAKGDVKIAGFFVVYNDNSMSCGYDHDEIYTQEMLGAIEQFKWSFMAKRS